jgi:hypothetical protein
VASNRVEEAEGTMAHPAVDDVRDDRRRVKFGFSLDLMVGICGPDDFEQFQDTYISRLLGSSAGFTRIFNYRETTLFSSSSRLHISW